MLWPKGWLYQRRMLLKKRASIDRFRFCFFSVLSAAESYRCS